MSGSWFPGVFDVTHITISHSDDLWGVISKRQTWQHYPPFLLGKDENIWLCKDSVSLHLQSHIFKVKCYIKNMWDNGVTVNDGDKPTSLTEFRSNKIMVKQFLVTTKYTALHVLTYYVLLQGLPYSIKQLELTVVVSWSCMNKTELNFVTGHVCHSLENVPLCGFTAVTQRSHSHLN